MIYTKETESYNERRYGKPYIALCNEKGLVATWGEWLGSEGGSGELSLEVPEGYCIVMRGQKDNRNPKNSAPYYACFLDGKPICVEIYNESEYFWTEDKFKVIKLCREKTKGQESK